MNSRSMAGLLLLIVLVPVLTVALRMAGDADIVRRLKAREGAALGDLYDRYGRLSYALIVRIVRNEAAAEDLVQETFLRIWNRAVSFDDQKGALGAWVLAVARNRAIDYLRSLEGRESRNAVDLEALERPALFSSLDNRALDLDRVRTIRSALDKLPPNHRIVLELAYFEGLSQTEMAERLKQPLGTVKTWVRAALRSVRDEIGQAAPA